MYISRRFYITLSVVVLVLASGYLWSPMFTVGRVLLLLFVVAVVADIILLWRTYVNTQRSTLNAFRQLSDRFSNGDENDVRIRVESSYPFPISVEVIDEIPFIFQRRVQPATYQAGCLWLRTDSGLRGFTHRTGTTPLHLWRGEGREGLSLIPHVASV